LTENTGQGDIVEVVASGVRQGARLSPPGKSAEHEARIAGEAHFRSEAQSFGNARSESFDHRICALKHAQQDRARNAKAGDLDYANPL
jgi:hypothetical protein